MPTVTQRREKMNEIREDAPPTVVAGTEVTFPSGRQVKRAIIRKRRHKMNMDIKRMMGNG